MVLEITEQRLKSAKDRVDRFIDENLVTWATEEILLPGQNDLLSSGISERGARGLKIEKTGFLKFDLIWDYRNEQGDPIHFFIEKDTRPHIIRAKGKLFGGADALHWKGPSGGFIIGEDHFAQEVKHPGTRGKGLIETIRKERVPALQRRVIAETANRMEIDSI